MVSSTHAHSRASAKRPRNGSNRLAMVKKIAYTKVNSRKKLVKTSEPRNCMASGVHGGRAAPVLEAPALRGAHEAVGPRAQQRRARRPSLAGNQFVTGIAQEQHHHRMPFGAVRAGEADADVEVQML